jgi:hypothetical protein
MIDFDFCVQIIAFMILFLLVEVPQSIMQLTMALTRTYTMHQGVAMFIEPVPPYYRDAHKSLDGQ